MSLEPGVFSRANSPASSDSSSPRLRRAKGYEDGLKKDKSYRRYASSIERALSLFDTALQEWADYISFLSRLLKALQSHPPELPIVPHKVVVAKRLAQCLNPSLPSGVHQKALEVYAHIFSFIKPEGLSNDLALYLPGIAPTLSFASLSVRPLFLSLIETYILEVEPFAIRPALKAIILALLPGLEDETSEDFESTLRIVNQFRNVANQMDTRRPSNDMNGGGQYFWQCLFLASITNPSRRPGVLAYLNRHLPKLGVIDHKAAFLRKGDVQEIPADLLVTANSIISPEPGLLIRCFTTGLADEQVLVQRNFLDLLVTHLPLHSPILQFRITTDDFDKLVIAAAGVVTRRDMSLNRRLWAWLLGPEASGASNDHASPESARSLDRPRLVNSNVQELSQSQYFSRFGLQPLVRGILNMIRIEPASPLERTKPLRISLSLMDRWEVGGFVVPAVFLPIMRSILVFENVAPKSQFDEVFRSASAFFDGVESSLIFSELLHLVDIRLNSNLDEILSNLRLAHFIVANFNVREEEMLLMHVPLLILSILVKIDNLQSAGTESSSLDNSKAVAYHLVNVINQLVGFLPERAFLRKTADKSSAASSPVEISSIDILRRIHEFYDRSKDSFDLPPLPFTPKGLSELVLREGHSIAISALEGRGDVLPIKQGLNLFISLLKKVQKSRVLRDNTLYAALRNRSDFAEMELTTPVFSIVSSIAFAAATLHSLYITGYHITHEQMSDLIPILVRQVWAFLSPSSPKFHVEAVHCLWLLHSVSWTDHLVEASVTSMMITATTAKSAHLCSKEQAEKFFVLWNHSHHGSYEAPTASISEEHGGQGRLTYQSSMLERPLFLVLDLLTQDSSESLHAIQEWLQDLPSINKLFYVVVSRLESLFERDSRNHGDNDAGVRPVSMDDFRECQYLFRTVSRILSSLSHAGWVAFISQSVSPYDKSHDASTSETTSDRKSFQTVIADACLAVICQGQTSSEDLNVEEVNLQQAALLLLRQLLLGLGAERLTESELSVTLIERLSIAVDQRSSNLQEAIIETLLVSLKIRFSRPLASPNSRRRRTSSRDTIMSTPLLSSSTDKVDKSQPTPVSPQPPTQLLDCLLKGISSPHSHGVLNKWIVLLCECLPIYAGTIFQILLTLVECFCKEIRSSYNCLQLVFKNTDNWFEDHSEHVTIALLTGLESCIATAHERLRLEEANSLVVRSPDHAQGFFGNMVSGVFTSDGNPGRHTANNRLTVLLCFQDAVRLCFSIWSWGAVGKGGTLADAESASSFQYTSLRMRNRSRRILEHLFTAEALECLETLIELWSKSAASEQGVATQIFNLLHTLDGARPKITIPALFNAIYSRTNPAALEPSRKSTMTSTIAGTELAAFLVTYARSLDDDVLDEIWTDCTTFLKDVLANPFPHRQILPRLVEFAAILGAKMENTTFGDDRRMRKDLGDLLLRLLTALFTSKPFGLSQDSSLSGRPSLENDLSSIPNVGPDDILSILAMSLPSFIISLSESDRISTVMSSISTNVIGPLLRSRLFPNNINRNVLAILQQMSKVPAASKLWRKDIGDAFNDARFFCSQVDVVKAGWMGILRQWVLVDKDRLSELLSRLTPPTSAGIMFGVGASAARLEADRKAQLTLRRVSLLILSAENDHFVGELSGLLQKLEDLLAATNVSSPSSATRAEIFLVFRSLILKTSSSQLAPMWPLVNLELQEAISAVIPRQQSELYNPYSLLQACKLLDTLLLLAPDDFQLQEWLFVTDTIDAVYPPGRWESVALVDEVSQSLGARDAASPIGGDINEAPFGLKRPWLTSDRIRETAKDEIVDRVLKPFFDRLSIHAFESTYGMGIPDLEACQDDLLADLFNESTMVS